MCTLTVQALSEATNMNKISSNIDKFSTIFISNIPSGMQNGGIMNGAGALRNPAPSSPALIGAEPARAAPTGAVTVGATLGIGAAPPGA